jgi:hypothetical protein
MNYLLINALSTAISIGNTEGIDNNNSKLDHKIISDYDTIKEVINKNLIYKTTAMANSFWRIRSVKSKKVFLLQPEKIMAAL